jgi:hypothetical protein
MDYIRIKKISEADFDTVVKEAGGSCILKQDSADYILNEALIELKFVEEEGFEKATRQRKLADIFRKQQPRKPVVVIRPESLDATGARDYYNAVARPIESHVRKAAKQLEKTAARYNPQPVRVLVILNIGYTALSIDEFKDICLKCVLKPNYNSRIDWVICGGLYFHSDKFDNYLLSRFEPFPINVTCLFPSCDVLLQAWNAFTESLATSLIREVAPIDHSRLPVLDLTFEVDGIRFVKPAPAVPSNVFPPGYQPRDNTSGINKCPPIVTAFPALSEINWHLFLKVLPDGHNLKSSYDQWLKFQQDEGQRLDEKLKPFITIDVTYENFTEWIKKPVIGWQFVDLCRFADYLFGIKIQDISFIEKDTSRIVPLEYIYVIIQEIGKDKANDLCSVYHISELLGFEHEELILENENLFLEYGGAIAASYAVKKKLHYVLYSKIKV